jgi:DNA-binding NtrC family response regulator
MSTPLLLIDDNDASHVLLSHIVAELPVVLHSAHSGEQGLRLARELRPALVLLDVRMPGMDGFEVLEALRADPTTALTTVIFLSAVEEPEARVRGLSAGAADYITKPFVPEEVVARIQGQLARIRREALLREQIDAALEAAARRERVEAPLLGDSVVAETLRQRVAAAAQVEARVFLVGETGSGHHAVARAIHRASRRRQGPLLVARRASDRAELESLATRWAQSEGGHLFVPDIQEVHPDVLAALGLLSVDDPGRLMASVEDRRQLPAWWAREEVRVLDLPPLRQRMEDIVPMARGILEQHVSRLGDHTPTLPSETRRRLRGHPWPGNVDELERVLKSALASTHGEELHIDEELLSGGASAGPYALVEPIGHGGMGTVYRARHRSLGREAVVKLITHRGDDRAVRRQFRHEAQVTSRLTSPHTVRLYDFGITDDGDFFYAMERLRGIDLRQLVKGWGPLGPSRTVYLLEQAAASLEEAHAMGLVHSDIKPENLFVSRAGLDRDVLKVLDFGVVRAVGAEGRLVGTPHYMAPEVLQSRPVDPRSDLYALGCVAMYLLTGQTVFSPRSMPALMLAHLEEAPVLPGERVPGIPPGLDALVAALLAKNPDDRVGSASELREALAALPLPLRWTQHDARQWWATHATDATQSSWPPDTPLRATG